MATIYKIGQELVLSNPDFTCGLPVLRDGSGISYRLSGRDRAFKKEREETRARFLVKLMEEYNYSEESIELDREVAGFGSADMVVYKKHFPYIVIDCGRAYLLKEEKDRALKELINKADALKAEYAVFVFGSEKIVFSLEPRLEIVCDVPVFKK